MKTQIALFSIAFIGLLSCQKAEISSTTDTNEETGKLRDYSFFCDAGDTRMAVGAITDGVAPANWEEGDAIGLFLTSNGQSAGTATVSSGTGTQYGKFTISSLATPGTNVRILYPATSTYGGGNLPTQQTITNIKQASLKYSFAYTDAFKLSDKDNSFSLNHAMATVLVKFVGDPNGIFNWTSSDGAFVTKIRVRCFGSALSGDFAINYDTGVVTPGAESKDYVMLTRNAGFNSTSQNTAILTTFPTYETQRIEVMLYIKGPSSLGSPTYQVPVMFKGQLKAGKLNVLDLEKVSLNPEYLQSMKTDYYAKYLAGEDIVIDDDTENPLVINKTTHPAANLYRAEDIADYGIFRKGEEIVFIDETSAEINLFTGTETSLAEIGNPSASGLKNGAIVIGRFRNAGSQPTFKVNELRINKYDVSFVNVKLESSGKYNMFGKQNAAANTTRLRLKDCQLVSTHNTYMIDILPSASTTDKTFSRILVDNCIVNLPTKNKTLGAQTGMIYQGKQTPTTMPAACSIVVRNSILFTTEKSITRNGSKGNWNVHLVYFDNSQKNDNLTILFSHNNICNILNFNGLVRFKNSRLNSVSVSDNFGFLEDISTEEGASQPCLTRRETQSGCTFTDLVSNNYLYVRNVFTTKYTTWVSTNGTYKFINLSGNTIKSDETGYDNYPLTDKNAIDVNVGYFPIDRTKVKTAGTDYSDKQYINIK